MVPIQDYDELCVEQFVIYSSSRDTATHPITMTPQQIQWLQDKGLQAKDVLQDDTGYYILITCSDGTQTNQYIPDDAQVETLTDEVSKEISNEQSIN